MRGIAQGLHDVAKWAYLFDVSHPCLLLRDLFDDLMMILIGLLLSPASFECLCYDAVINYPLRTNMNEDRYLSLPCVFANNLAFRVNICNYTTMTSVLEDTGEVVSLAVCPIGEIHRIVR